MGIKKWGAIFGMVLCMFAFNMPVGHASEENSDWDSLIGSYGIDDMDFSEIQEIIKQTGVTKTLSFRELVKSMMQGDMVLTGETVVSWIKEALFSEIHQSKEMVVTLLGIGIMAAVFYHIAMAFSSQQVAEISFFIAYMAFLAVSMAAFQKTAAMAESVMMQFEDFVRALIPSFFLAVAASSGSYTAIGFYRVTLVVLSFFNGILIRVVLPMIKIAVVLTLINHISKEEMLSKTISLVKTGIGWILKGILAAVIGINALQGLILPSVDGMKTMVMQKTVSMIPGVGGSAEAVTQLLTGSGILMKNAIGTAGCIVMICITLIPLIQVGMFTLIYHLLGAMLQPVSDKRMIEALCGISEGGKLLFQMIATTLILFVLMIAIVCAVTMKRW